MVGCFSGKLTLKTESFRGMKCVGVDVLGGWVERGSPVMNVCCSARGPKFNSQHPFLAAHNYL